MLLKFCSIKLSQKYLISCLCFIFGMGIASFFYIDITASIVCVVFLYVLQAILRYASYGKRFFGEFKVIVFVRPFLPFLCFVFLGILIFELDVFFEQEGDHIRVFNEQTVEFVGQIITPPKKGVGQIKYTVEATELIYPYPNKQIKGKVLVKSLLYPEFAYESSVRVKCSLKEPEDFEDFPYKKYLFRYGVYSICNYAQVYEVKRKNEQRRIFSYLQEFKGMMEDNLNQVFHEPYSSIAAALVLGEKGGLDQDLLNQVSNAGLSHVIVISGLHITILSQIVFIGLGYFRIPRKKRVYITMLFLVFYATLLNFPPSAVRGVIMASLLFLALNLGRPYKQINSLCTAAVIMLLFDPRMFVFDVGFQLSFSATIGILFLNPLLKTVYKPENGFGLVVVDMLVVSFSAIIMTLPLILFHFGKLSLIAPMANIFVLPIVPCIILMSLVVLGISFFSIILARIVALLPWFLLKYFVVLVQLASGFKYSYLEVKIDFVTMIFIYIILISLTVFSWSFLKRVKK